MFSLISTKLLCKPIYENFKTHENSGILHSSTRSSIVKAHIKKPNTNQKAHVIRVSQQVVSYKYKDVMKHKQK